MISHSLVDVPVPMQYSSRNANKPNHPPVILYIATIVSVLKNAHVAGRNSGFMPNYRGAHLRASRDSSSVRIACALRCFTYQTGVKHFPFAHFVCK